MHNKLDETEVSYKQFDLKTANEVACKLRELRKEKFKSTEEFRIQCDFKKVPATFASMINYERLLRNNKSDSKKQSVKGMRLATFYELCKFYNVSPNYLLVDNASRHCENTADNMKAEWGFDDDTLAIFKRALEHKDIGVGDMSETEFLNLIIKECFVKLEMPAAGFVSAMKEKEDFENKYLYKDTGYIKAEYILDEVSLTDTYQEFQAKCTANKIDIINKIEKYFDDVYKKIQERCTANKVEMINIIEGFLDTLYKEVHKETLGKK